MRSLILMTIVFQLVLACGHDDFTEMEEEMMEETMDTKYKDIRFLALGDSYTIGESVAVAERWPVQLASRLEKDSVHISELNIIARTGWRTNQLLDAIEEQKPSENYDLVSLLIGVNNQYRDLSIDQYRSEFTTLLESGIRFARGERSHVFVVSIPDYAYTPFGQSQDTAKITRELNVYNTIAQEICNSYDIPFINITDISRRGLDEPNLVADDRLHPSGDMYTLWVERMYTTVYEMIKR